MTIKKLQPIVKWAGGKELELKYIFASLPDHFDSYYEPFVGGGAVFTAIQARQYFINDRSEELISLYKNISSDKSDGFFNAVEEIISAWNRLTVIAEENAGFFVSTYKKYTKNAIGDIELKDILTHFISNNRTRLNGIASPICNTESGYFAKEIEINLTRKIRRMKYLEQLKAPLPEKDIQNNIETALKSAFYMLLRGMYNSTKVTSESGSAIFLFIRNFAYGGMFRYNSRGEFNVPYGGIGYNRKNLKKKIDYLRSPALRQLLQAATIENSDFYEFLKNHRPGSGDFIFLDPPYDSEFSTYANNEFTKDDQLRLSRYLTDECKAKWMLVIKNTDYIYNLYQDKGLNIKLFNKNYLVSFMNRNDKQAEHLLITNY